MRFPPEILNDISSRLDVATLVGEYTALKPMGKDFKGLCPFHQEKSPSFTVSVEKGLYHCFGCQVGGNMFHFIMQLENLNFPEAVKLLARRVGIDLSALNSNVESSHHEASPDGDRELYLRINRYSAWYFHEQLKTDQGQRGRDYLVKRQITPDLVARFQLGYAPKGWDGLVKFLSEKKVPLDKAEQLGLIKRREGGGTYDFYRDRLIFPICDEQSNIIAFGGRRLDDSDLDAAKYINSPESPIYHKSDSIYALDQAKKAIRKSGFVYLVEGYLDCLRLHEVGLTNAVAPLGTAFTMEQAQRLKRLTSHVVLVFDGDSAGRRAFMKATQLFLDLGIHPKGIVLPEGSDPDDFIASQGVSAFASLATKAVPAIEWFMAETIKGSQVGTSHRMDKIRAIVPLVARLTDALERKTYLQQMSQYLEVSARDLDQLLSGHWQKPVLGKVSEKNRQLSAPFDRLILGLYLNDPILMLKLGETIELDNPELNDILIKLNECQRRQEVFHLDRFIEELSIEQARWVNSIYFEWQSYDQGTKDKLTQDGIAKWRKKQLRNLLKKVTGQIRAAELSHDETGLTSLLTEKNKLLIELREKQ